MYHIISYIQFSSRKLGFGCRKYAVGWSMKVLGGINLYICDLRQIGIEEDYREILGRLDGKAAERVLRYFKEDDRQRALVREVMLSFILRMVFRKNDVTIEKNRYGKPIARFLHNTNGCTVPDLPIQDFDFSISHSGSLVAIAFGEGAMGLDVELIGSAGNFRELLHFFTDEEQDRVSCACNQECEFYRIWTFREAFSKKEGVGLTIFEQPDSIRIDYDENEVCFRGKKAVFFEHEYAGHQIALCTENIDTTPEVLIVGRKTWNEMTSLMEDGNR